MANKVMTGLLFRLLVDGQPSPAPLFMRPDLQFDQAGSGVTSGYSTATTTATALNVANNGTINLALVYNLDAVNFVQLGWDAGGFQPAIKVLPGQFGLIPLEPTRTWLVQSDTADVNIQAIVLDA